MNRRKGSSIIELGAGLIVLVPIFLYGVDYATVFFANQFNANVCRDAARAAASGPPTMFCPGGTGDGHRPRMRAKAVIDRSSQANAWIRVDPTFKMWEVINEPTPVPPYGGPVSGFVRIQTTATLTPPFKLPYVDKQVKLTREEQFPYTWTMPINYTGVPAPAPGSRVPKITDSDS